jgi:hypothetical protein
VYVCDGGPLGHLVLPASFTDRDARPPSAHPLTVDILADVAAIVSALSTGLTAPREERTRPCI